MTELKLVDSTWAKMRSLFDDHPCGECTACCTILGVADLGKPYYTSCKSICPSGCSIYKDRPDGCKGFECVWRAGFLDGIVDNGRPDNLGLMFDLESDDTGEWLSVYETMPMTTEQISDLVLLLFRKIGQLTGIRIYPYEAKIPVVYSVSDNYSEFKHLEANGRSRWFRRNGSFFTFYDEAKSLEQQ